MTPKKPSPNLATDLKINPHSLHTEWIKQPELYGKWAILHVEAIGEKEQAKLDIDVFKANKDAEVRKSWDALGFEKPPTEAAIQSYITKLPEYTKKMVHFSECTRRVNLFAAARDALEHKKRALEGLERLHLQGYYSTLTTSAEGSEIIRQTGDAEANSSLAENPRIRRMMTLKTGEGNNGD